MRYLGIDPGELKSAWVVIDDTDKVESHALEENDKVRARLHGLAPFGTFWLWGEEPIGGIDIIVEWTRTSSSTVAIFETAWWSGRFAEAARGESFRLPRLKVKQHLGGKSTATDAAINAAILKRYGSAAAVGIPTAEWQALATALTWSDGVR